MITEHPVLDALQGRFPGSLDVIPAVDQPTVRIPKDMVPAVMRWLRDEQGFSLLIDVTAVDWYPERPRFEVVYHVLNPATMWRVRVKTWVHLGESVPSVTPIWPGANWPERETFDLFGIVFEGHPDLRRIYLPDDWEGHPLRKDYPVAGPRVD